ncbi:unnamed protein product, partial [Musa hybrid cultivar]
MMRHTNQTCPMGCSTWTRSNMVPGRSGIMVRPKCQLTVVVRETTPEEEAKIAKLQVSRKLTRRERQLPKKNQRLPSSKSSISRNSQGARGGSFHISSIETTPRWDRKGMDAAALSYCHDCVLMFYIMDKIWHVSTCTAIITVRKKEKKGN